MLSLSYSIKAVAQYLDIPEAVVKMHVMDMVKNGKPVDLGSMFEECEILCSANSSEITTFSDEAYHSSPYTSAYSLTSSSSQSGPYRQSSSTNIHELCNAYSVSNASLLIPSLSHDFSSSTYNPQTYNRQSSSVDSGGTYDSPNASVDSLLSGPYMSAQSYIGSNSSHAGEDCVDGFQSKSDCSDVVLVAGTSGCFNDDLVAGASGCFNDGLVSAASGCTHDGVVTASNCSKIGLVTESGYSNDVLSAATGCSTNGLVAEVNGCFKDGFVAVTSDCSNDDLVAASSCSKNCLVAASSCSNDVLSATIGCSKNGLLAAANGYFKDPLTKPSKDHLIISPSEHLASGPSTDIIFIEHSPTSNSVSWLKNVSLEKNLSSDNKNCVAKISSSNITNDCPISTSNITNDCPMSTSNITYDCPMSSSNITHDCPMSTNNITHDCPMSSSNITHDCPLSTSYITYPILSVAPNNTSQVDVYNNESTDSFTLPMLEFPTSLLQSLTSELHSHSSVLTKEGPISNVSNIDTLHESNKNRDINSKDVQQLTLSATGTSSNTVPDLVGEINFSNTCLKLVEREHELLEKSRMCSECFVKPKDITFLPCGHFATCRGCADPLYECPLCQANILATVDTYLS